MAKRKNPWIAAILNFFIWGVGYLYNGRRIGLGLGLLISLILFYIGVLVIALNVNEIETSPNATTETFGLFWYLSILSISVAIAYDAYKEAKGK